MLSCEIKLISINAIYGEEKYSFILFSSDTYSNYIYTYNYTSTIPTVYLSHDAGILSPAGGARALQVHPRFTLCSLNKTHVLTNIKKLNIIL